MVEALEYDLQTAENEIVEAQQELFDAVWFIIVCGGSGRYFYVIFFIVYMYVCISGLGWAMLDAREG